MQRRFGLGLLFLIALAGPAPAGDASDHWAFRPISDPAPPAVRQTSWVRDPIDCFVLSRLESAGLAPSARADRRTLLRRASFDLLGLPPTPEETARFEDDPAPEAFENAVERLLASPHYGERWARHWLDVARYADNRGYIFFGDPNYPWAYAYRDYVVAAFNSDLPFNEFVLQQLAADQLDLGNERQPLAAMGFLTVGGRFMENFHDVLDDRIDVITRGLLGLTVTCARCHDHKYDPITQGDYYALYGVLRSSDEPTVAPLFSPAPQSDEYREFEKQLQARMADLGLFVRRKHSEVVGSARRRVADYLMAVYQAQHQPTTEGFMLIAEEGEINPTLVLRWRLYLESKAKARDPIWAPWHALAEIPSEQFTQRATEALADWHREQSSSVNPLVYDALARSPLASMQQVAQRYGELLQRIDQRWQDAVHAAVEAGLPVPERLAEDAEEQLRQTLFGSDAPANVPPRMGQTMLELLPDRPSQEQLKKLLGELDGWLVRGPGAPPRAMALNDLEEPYDPRVFLRGNPDRPGEAVPRRFLGVLGGEAFRQGSGRLELARAIVDPQNPLTARVLVNRVWAHHFGAGLVRTPSDFGRRSEPPSHPELLDHLASTFMREGWSIKQLHRRILLSATYQQAGEDREDLRQVDPENRLLGKMNRRRLDFESLRDATLAVAGALDRRLAGPSVNLLDPPFVPRRTLYGFVDRLNLPGLYRTFDFPDPLAHSPQRDSTTVPPQALFLMNNDFAMESARRLAARPDVTNQPTLSQRVERLYALVYARSPRSDEARAAEEFLGPVPTTEAWTEFAHALLMSNEFAYLD